MEHHRALGPIRRGSPAPTDDQIARVMRYCGGRTPASRDRAIVWLSSRARLIGEEPSAEATLRYLPPRPAEVVIRPREVMPPPVMARRPHVCCHGGLSYAHCSDGRRDDPVFTTVHAPEHEPGCPTLFQVQYGVTFDQIWWSWADVTTIVAIGEFHPADSVAKRSAVEATVKELWGKAGIVVPDFYYFKLKAHEAGDATITATAVAICESFKHSSDLDNSFFFAQPSLKYILRYVADRLSYTVRCPAPLHEFGRCTKLYQAEVKFVRQISERHNFSIVDTIENRPTWLF
ncbi:hypothetical protein ACP4OV_007631 [Aristida adscensionis]